MRVCTHRNRNCVSDSQAVKKITITQYLRIRAISVLLFQSQTQKVDETQQFRLDNWIEKRKLYGRQQEGSRLRATCSLHTIATTSAPIHTGVYHSLCFIIRKHYEIWSHKSAYSFSVTLFSLILCKRLFSVLSLFFPFPLSPCLHRERDSVLAENERWVTNMKKSSCLEQNLGNSCDFWLGQIRLLNTVLCALSVAFMFSIKLCQHSNFTGKAVILIYSVDVPLLEKTNGKSVF